MQGSGQVKQPSNEIGTYLRTLGSQQRGLVMESCDLSYILISFWLLCGEEFGSQRTAVGLSRSSRSQVRMAAQKQSSLASFPYPIY